MNRRALIASLLGVAACMDQVSAQPVTQGLRLATFGHSSLLDPFTTSIPNVSDIAWLFADGLIGTDRRGPRGLLALRVPSSADGSISRDGKEIYYELRRDVRWHDGKPFEAEDVVATFRRVQDSPWRSIYPYHLVRSVKALDAHRVRVDLTERDARFPLGFLSAYGDPNLPLIRAGRLPIGTGPFALKEHSERTGYYSLTRWQASARRAPDIDVLSYAFVPDQATEAIELASGDVDVALYVPPAIVEAHGLRSARYTGGTLVLLANAAGRLMDSRLRRIVWRSINRDVIREKSFAGWALRADSILPPGIVSPFRFPRYDEADAEAARRDVSAEYPGGVHLTFAGVPGLAERIGLLLQAQLARSRISLDLKVFSPAEYFALEGPLRSGRFDLALDFAPSSLDPDFMSAFGCRGTLPLSTNHSRFCDPAVEQAIEHAQYGEMERILAEKAIVMPIAHILHCIGLGPRVKSFRVQNYVPITYYCNEWSLK